MAIRARLERDVTNTARQPCAERCARITQPVIHRRSQTVENGDSNSGSCVTIEATPQLGFLWTVPTTILSFYYFKRKKIKIKLN